MSKLHQLCSWSWQKHQMSRNQIRKRGNIIKCERLKLLNDPPIDWDRIRRNDFIAITGDGNTLQSDVAEFESWNIPHDLYCVNRSLLYFQRQVDHWAAIDSEESAWFTEWVSGNVEKTRPVLRHTIGYFPGAYDIWWEQVYPFTSDFQRRIFIGNSGYFAVLTALQMGYKQIILLGIPLNHEAHWYEPDEEQGPNWAGLAFTQWMDLCIKYPEEADKIRSLSGYSAWMLGQATKEWAENGLVGRIATTLS